MTLCVFDFFLYLLSIMFPTGPAQVPMMSPNGSVPQIYVPPGYVQQVSHYGTSFILFLWELFWFDEKDAIFSLIYVSVALFQTVYASYLAAFSGIIDTVKVKAVADISLQNDAALGQIPAYKRARWSTLEQIKLNHF